VRTGWRTAQWRRSPHHAIGGANLRGGPSISAPLTGPFAGRLPGGSPAWVARQRAGAQVGGTRIWYQVSHRHWVSGNYAAAPGTAGFTKPAPRC
jgi:hypothetical protein